jgi:ABC-type thiamin/hydroxymethylpyrimidine transport system permease subunit
MKPLQISQQLYYRLIALWVVCEALLGGIIHGFKLPVSGLIVGSSAVICICLIAFYVPVKGAILKATIIVAVFKMMLSPQSPLPAYFAVFFQGLVAELVFYRRLHYKTSCLLFAIIALLESSTQRILVMTIVYGENSWKAFNAFVADFTKQSANYAGWLIGLYIACHLFVGVAIGWFAGVLPARLDQWNREEFFINQGRAIIQSKKRQSKFKWVLLVIWVGLMLLFLQSYFSVGKPLLPSNISLKILLRSVVVVLTWYFVLSPLLIRLLKSWLEKKKESSHQTIEEIISLLPSVKFIVVRGWQLSSSQKGVKRLSRFSKIVLVNTIGHA